MARAVNAPTSRAAQISMITVTFIDSAAWSPSFPHYSRRFLLSISTAPVPQKLVPKWSSCSRPFYQSATKHFNMHFPKVPHA